MLRPSQKISSLPDSDKDGGLEGGGTNVSWGKAQEFNYFFKKCNRKIIIIIITIISR